MPSFRIIIIVANNHGFVLAYFALLVDSSLTTRRLVFEPLMALFLISF